MDDPNDRKYKIRMEDIIEKNERIGGGSFGNVYKGKVKFENKLLTVAIKVLKESNFNNLSPKRHVMLEFEKLSYVFIYSSFITP